MPSVESADEPGVVVAVYRNKCRRHWEPVSAGTFQARTSGASGRLSDAKFPLAERKREPKASA